MFERREEGFRKWGRKGDAGEGADLGEGDAWGPKGWG